MIQEPIYSADKTTNDVVFARIMQLYVRRPAVGADPTWGRGTFWKSMDMEGIELHASDLADGGPCLTCLPHSDSTLDFLVLDPPYMDGFFRPSRAQEAHGGGDFSSRYGNHTGGGYVSKDGQTLFYQPAVHALYADGIVEAARVLRQHGVLIVKCQDAVSNHRQHLTHCIVWQAAARAGFRDLDLFVVVRRDRPHTRRLKNQEHSRKNHSYFMVFERGPK